MVLYKKQNKWNKNPGLLQFGHIGSTIAIAAVFIQSFQKWFHYGFWE